MFSSGLLACGSGHGTSKPPPVVSGTGGSLTDGGGYSTAMGGSGGRSSLDGGASDAAVAPTGMDAISSDTAVDAGVAAAPDVPLGQDLLGSSDATNDTGESLEGPPVTVDAAGVPADSAVCAFTILTSSLSPVIPTVGIVEWSTDHPGLQSASIVYTLRNPGGTVLNRGGTAPVDLAKPSYRTLLLGLKQSSEYTFHIEVTGSWGACASQEYSLPRTGTLLNGPTVTRQVANVSAQAKGFIVTSGGMMGSGAYIIDADGAVVWAALAPKECSRARMDYEGINMWMLKANAANALGEMRYVSMEGMSGQSNVRGLESAHHDFTVIPGKIVALAWATPEGEAESNLVELAADGTGETTTLFKVGANLYQGKPSAGGQTYYHANSVLFHPADDTFTIGDRYASLYVKVKRDGTPLWQIGGSCSDAKAAKCAEGTWSVNHGHDFAPDGNIVFFNNTAMGASHAVELAIAESETSISISEVADYAPGPSSGVLGDVQRLPNGNTLVTFSTAGQIIEVDATWGVVQTLRSSFGYADWRETLYGPPAR